MLYNIKHLLVISHSRGYLLSLIVIYSIISAYYALVLGNRPFPNLLFNQILLFPLYLRKCVNNLAICPQKSTFAKFKADFLAILNALSLKTLSEGVLFAKSLNLHKPYHATYGTF